MLLWMNVQKSPHPCSQSSVKVLSEGVEAVVARGDDQIHINAHGLEMGFSRTDWDVMVRCLQSFGCSIHEHY